MDTKTTHKPLDFPKIACNYITAEVAAGNISPKERPHFENLYLRALTDDYKTPLPNDEKRVSSVEAVITSRKHAKIETILDSSPLGKATLKRQRG